MVAMSKRKILYTANFQRIGKSFRLGAIVLLLAGIMGFVWCFYYGNILVSVVAGIFVFGMGLALAQVSKWRRGIYEIYTDSIGLHVHSDEPRVGKSFSVAAMNLHHLIRKRIGNGEDIEHEFYVEEKNGERHKLSPKLANYDLSAMDVFEEIASEFPSVKIVEE
jgi:hypothetical protein